MMTPLPVPIHRRLEEMRRAVIRTNEKPTLPVPRNKYHNHFSYCILCTQYSVTFTSSSYIDSFTVQKVQIIKMQNKN